MQFQEMRFPDARPVEGYGPGFFRLQGQVFTGPIFVRPLDVAPWGGFDDIETIINAKDSFDVLFIGTGDAMTPLPRHFRAALDAAGLGGDPMSSPSACRTFNVLLNEGRRIAMAILPVSPPVSAAVSTPDAAQE